MKQKRLKYAEINEKSLNPYIEYKSQKKNIKKKKSQKTIKNKDIKNKQNLNDRINISINDEINKSLNNNEQINEKEQLNENEDINIKNKMENSQIDKFQIEEPISCPISERKKKI